MNEFYKDQDKPTSVEKFSMWNEISSELNLDEPKQAKILQFHWKSFWIGQAAAVLVALALVGLITTIQVINAPNTSTEKYQQALQSASSELSSISDLFIEEASEAQKPNLESTVQGIQEIDILIDELKDDIIMNGMTPAKEIHMKRLYATKLDFYKEILLINEDQL